MVESLRTQSKAYGAFDEDDLPADVLKYFQKEMAKILYPLNFKWCRFFHAPAAYLMSS